jgi:hypothetical protein
VSGASKRGVECLDSLGEFRACRWIENETALHQHAPWYNLPVNPAAALDCVAESIRVNRMIPGATETQMLKEHFENKPAEEARLLDKISLRRLTTTQIEFF